MAKAIEIRWHGRGGQGTVTAAKVLADACLSGGGYVQAFPEYGPERAGAPIRAFNRVSEKVIRMYGPVLHPRVISIADATLIDTVNVTEGAPDDAIYIVNTSKDPKEVRKKLKAKDSQEVYAVDATKIAVDSFGRPLPNSSMLGAICKVTEIVNMDTLLDSIKKSFGKKFAQKIIDGNLEAAKRGYEEVKQG
ncbi:MAG TPA: pyruvate synthase [Nitrospirae bacterium]|nr:pyruvate synthase subunit PorC [bacterium BMS3Abin10]GBE38931.1 pyruvate synthase subunit PorC [bacterium BMS3Bbin08]HDH50607.1 pyruvate synthase [Nitrospirota bacterium]HDK16680.1 pyruvate synthase [Nitrospirota bacterium]HDK82479.1 pyruvate synthase [Nitrospirota bacterium]